jgi:hypothetical protein
VNAIGEQFWNGVSLNVCVCVFYGVCVFRQPFPQVLPQFPQR